MRICRYIRDEQPTLAFYFDEVIVDMVDAVALYQDKVGQIELRYTPNPLDVLPCGNEVDDAHTVWNWLNENKDAWKPLAVPTQSVPLKRPLERPGKVFMLAGNYVEHIKEGGEAAVERAETFPYIFMKPENTFNDPFAPVPIPKVSPDYIDYECELAIVIGKECKHVTEANALEFVAGYMVVNDIYDRKYRPFPDRKKRERDAFFDWQHGKWHDGFCCMGPCIASARSIPDPQTLALKLTVNGEVRQDASTAQMVFPVAAVIEFVSRLASLAPGDIISTGTPSGVGMASGTYLKNGDVVEASVERIGTLKNVMSLE